MKVSEMILHVVNVDETLEGIAKSYNIPYNILITLNPQFHPLLGLRDPDKIYPGERIVVDRRKH